MKKIILFLVPVFIIFLSCSKEEMQPAFNRADAFNQSAEEKQDSIPKSKTGFQISAQTIKIGNAEHKADLP